jgi:hypothetical protein
VRGDDLASTNGLVVVDAAIDLGTRPAQTVFNLHTSGPHTFFVSPSVATADVLVHNAAACRQGGVYALVSNSGAVVRTGRTNDLGRRMTEHGRAYEGLNFKILHVTNDKVAQRGLEQMVHGQYRPILNRVAPISRWNPRRATYIRAAQKHLSRVR